MKNALETWTFRCLIFFCTVQSWKSGQVRYKKRSSYSFACQNRICWITVLNFSKYFHTQQHFEFSRLKSFQVLCRKTLGTTLSFFQSCKQCEYYFRIEWVTEYGVAKTNPKVFWGHWILRSAARSFFTQHHFVPFRCWSKLHTKSPD